MKSTSNSATVIHNLNNSFSSISDGSTVLWMDPFKSHANLGAWAQWGANLNCIEIMEQIKVSKVDFIYISHLHSDHFDIKFLKEFESLNQEHPTILVKEFKSKRLRDQIGSVWPDKKIIEVPEYKLFAAGTLEIAILPQLSSSSFESENIVDYDLDTSCVVKTKDAVIFNEVDNPYSIEDYATVLKKLKELGLQKVDIAFVGYSGASDYPQSYLEIDRMAESKSIKKKSIDRFFKVGNLLETKYLIPAGGTYLLDTPFDYLNDYIAVPSFAEINDSKKDEVKNNKKEDSYALINPLEEFLSVTKGVVSVIKRQDNLPIKPYVSASSGDLPYALKTKDDDQLKAAVIQRVETIEQEFPHHFLKVYEKLRTSISICVHSEVPKYQAHSELLKKAIYSWPILANSIKLGAKKTISIELHISGDAFLKWTSGTLSWNELTYHCIYLRRPNTYEPDAMMFLNWYRTWK